MPVELNSCLAEFEKYYGSKFKGRKLNWMPFLGKSVLKASYSSKKEFVASNI